jgi:phosphoglycerate dehydrogenase-like enzyme
MDARIAIAPQGSRLPSRVDDEATEHRRRVVAEAVREAGGSIVAVSDANGLIWLDGDPAPLAELLDANPEISWVQLPAAGVEAFASAGIFTRPVMFTCAKGSFAEQVAEHALMLALACLRQLVAQARVRAWHGVEVISLRGKRVTILGAGGIAEVLIRLLQPFECHIRVLRRRAEPVEGANESLPITELHSVLPETDVLVLALALTSDTRHIIGQKELDLLSADAVVVNVARGAHIDTEALTVALQDGRIAAAGLDVTDPEPLPSDHPLWSLDAAVITSHCADSTSFVTDKLGQRVRENVGRFRRAEPLVGVVDADFGY